MKVTTQKLADHVKLTKNAVSMWFYRNKRSIMSLDDIADFIYYHRIKK